jgi:V/A-type H+-transporting ATPase subunit F
MKLVVIGHPEAVQGFALTGVQGEVATNVEEVNQALDKALASKDIGIILITEDVSSLIEERMERLKLQSTIPLVVEIPGPEGTNPDRSSLSELIQHAVGIKL